MGDLTMNELKCDVRHMTEKLGTWAGDILLEAKQWPDSRADGRELLRAMRECLVKTLVDIGYGEQGDIEEELEGARREHFAEGVGGDMDGQTAEVLVDMVEQRPE